MCDVIYDEGIHLGGTDLWFDAKKKVNLSFISNANISSVPHHDRIIATPETLKLIEGKTKNSIVLSCPYNRPFTVGKTKVELIPSGYSLGSSQIVTEIKGKRLVYTGDLKVRYSATSQYIEIRRCDVLIMKCRYGHPKFHFPPDEEVNLKIYEFIKESFYFNYTPVIFVDVLGKAQDLIFYLCNMNIKLSIHRSIYRYLEPYSEFGFEFKNVEKFRVGDLNRKVLIFPIHRRTAKNIEKIDKKRTCVVTGLAAESHNVVKSAFKVDNAFAMSNHAGYDELIQYVEIVNPKEVYLIEGFCVEFANKLRSLGYNARPIENPVQLKLI